MDARSPGEGQITKRNGYAVAAGNDWKTVERDFARGETR